MEPETYAPPGHYYFPDCGGESSSLPTAADINRAFGGSSGDGLTYGQRKADGSSNDMDLLVGSGGFLFTAGDDNSYCTSSSLLLNDLCRSSSQRGGGVATTATTTSGSRATFPSADEKALLALRNHKEAEKRRRERINSHLDRLRSLLPCSTKTDKATLLAQVVHRVQELNKEATNVITQQHGQGNIIPTQNDEYSVNHETSYYDSTDDTQNLVLRTSICCEDRSDLLSDLMEMVNSLNLKTVRAEMLSLGGRATNVLVLSGRGDRCRAEEYVAFLQDALKGILQRSSTSAHGGVGDRSKRRRR